MNGGSCEWAYAVLGLSSEADFDEARRAYRKLALLLHPDRGGSSKEQFQHVSAAWEAIRTGREASGGASHRLLAERVSLDSFERHGDFFVLPCRCGDVFEVSSFSADSCHHSRPPDLRGGLLQRL